MDVSNVGDFAWGGSPNLVNSLNLGMHDLFCHPTTAPSRHYPYRFGLRLLRILPQLQEDGCSKKFPDIPKRFCPLTFYKSLDFDDMWEDAGIPQVMEYISSNKHLAVPSKWKDHLFP